MSNQPIEGSLYGIQNAGQQWVGGVIINPITTEGDVIIGGSSGTPIRLGLGSNGQVLTSNGTRPYWATIAGGGSVSSVTSTNSDISVANTTTTPSLTLNSSATPSVSKIAKYDTNANLETNGLISKIRKLTSDFNFAVTDYTVEVDTTSSTVTGTLPASASYTGQIFTIAIVAGANSATIAAQAGEFISGAASWTFYNVGSSISAQSDGTGWALLY